MTAEFRLPVQPVEVLDRTRPVRFTWRDDEYSGYHGDTIASALAAAGVSTFSRSLKYRRRRGILTARADDPGLLVTAADEPNVRAAHRQVREGLRVSPQNVWPGLDVDFRSVVRLGGSALGPGFYYKTFMAPALAVPWYRRVLRSFAPGGSVDVTAGGWREFSENRSVDVLVVGGGPAGMSAAVASADQGASVMLVDENRWLGGHLGDRPWDDAVGDLVARTSDHPRVECLLDATALGRFDDNLVPVVLRDDSGRERILRVRARLLIVASGMVERPYVFAGNDLPGVMLPGAVRRLVHRYAVRPGSRAVIYDTTGAAGEIASDLTVAGVDVVATMDGSQVDLVEARGGRRVERVVGSDGSSHACDLLVVSVGHTAMTNLLTMAGGRHRFMPDNGRFRVEGLPPEVMAAGHVTGDGTLDALIAHGEAVGAEAARRLASAAPLEVDPLPPRSTGFRFRSSTHGFVDLCEDVTSKDVLAAVGEGFGNIETVKRFTTASMGHTQGRYEVVNLAAVMAEALGSDIATVGITTWRPPFVPTKLGALAGGHIEPTRISPIHDAHVERGATLMPAGAWLRPEHYGDPGSEVRAVRGSVGVIDVSPLGKFDLRGPDVASFLEHVYVNRWAGLEVGRVRYGIMCADDGVVFDDGVTGRLADQRYLMTTTSSGADRVGEWLDDVLSSGRFDVVFEQVTDAYASINVAGPRSRELIGRVCRNIDLDDFPYMSLRIGTVADVPDALMWRIGFTGEASYEVHVAAEYGRHVWDTLLDAGADLGVQPFGVEAQRILRLEKGHVIVGQDTDGLTGPHAIGMGPLVKTDKADFLGRPELARPGAALPPARLVSIRIEGDVVPEEASLLVAGSRIVGRITSSRWSPILGRPVCLGFVSAELASPGTSLTVNLPTGTYVTGTVEAEHAQYDPEGARVRA